MRANDSRSIENPCCRRCRDRGWTYRDVGAEWPVRRTCTACSDEPEVAYVDRWGHVPVEEPAGDVNDHGDYISDAA